MGLSTDLKAYWSLEEASGTRADATGRGNTLTPVSSTGNATGKVGNGASVTGSGSVLQKTDTADLSTGDVDFALWAWVKMTTLNNRTILSKYVVSGNQREYLLFYNQNDHATNNRFAWAVSNNGTTVTTIDANAFGAASTDTWYFVGCYHDATNNVIGIGVNDTWNTTAYSSGVLDSTAMFQLGALDSGVYLQNGVIDEVGMVKGYIPTSADWTWLYNSGNGRSYADVAAYEVAGQPMALRRSQFVTGAQKIGRGF